MSQEILSALGKVQTAIGVPLTYTNGRVTGSGKAVIRGDDGFEVPLHIKAIASFESSQFGVVFDIVGDLAIICAYYSRTDTLSMYVVDKAKVGGDLKSIISKKMQLIEVVRLIKPAIVSAYYNSVGTWKSLSVNV